MSGAWRALWMGAKGEMLWRRRKLAAFDLMESGQGTGGSAGLHEKRYPGDDL